MPPVVAAVATFADGLSTVPREFYDAWTEMHDVVAALLAGEAENADTPSGYSIITKYYEANIAQARRCADDDRSARLLAQIAAAVEADPDGYVELYLALAKPAMYFGIAFALYLTIPTAPPLHVKGGLE